MKGTISNSAGTQDKIQSSVYKPSPNLIDSTSNQNDSRLADLERRVGRFGKSMEIIEGETEDVVGEQINALLMIVT